MCSHGPVVLFLADDPGMRLHDIAARLRITERTAHGIVTDLTAAGYISKHQDGRRERYQIVAHQPLPEPITREKTFREVLALFPGAAAGQPPAESGHRLARRFAVCKRSGHVSHQASPFRLNLIGEPS
jgi:MarR family protein